MVVASAAISCCSHEYQWQAWCHDVACDLSTVSFHRRPIFFSSFFHFFRQFLPVSLTTASKQASKGASKQGRRKERVVLVGTTFAFCQTLWDVCHFYFFFGVLVVGPRLPWCCGSLVLWYFGGSSGGSNAAVVMAVGVAVLVMIIVALEGEVEV